MILEYERRTNFPTYIGNARFCVDDRGAVFVQVNRAEPPLDHEWTADYPATPAATVRDARAAIDAVLASHGFAAMAPLTEGEHDDGYREQLTYWDAAGAPRTVIVDGGPVPAFRALVNALAATLGITTELR